VPLGGFAWFGGFRGVGVVGSIPFALGFGGGELWIAWWVGIFVGMVGVGGGVLGGNLRRRDFWVVVFECLAVFCRNWGGVGFGSLIGPV